MSDFDYQHRIFKHNAMMRYSGVEEDSQIGTIYRKRPRQQTITTVQIPLSTSPIAAH